MKTNLKRFAAVVFAGLLTACTAEDFVSLGPSGDVANAVTAVSLASNGLSITLTLTNFVTNSSTVAVAYTANSTPEKQLSDASGNTVASNSSLSSITVTNDTNAPTVSSVSSNTADGTYNIGDVIEIAVTFSEVVTVTGTPQLTLETGTTDRTADYASGSGSNTLVFNYTVQSGDTTSDLAYTGASSLALNGGTILDNANNSAVLTLPTVGGTGSLSNASAVVVDGVRPAFTAGATTGGTKSLVLSLGEAVSGAAQVGGQ